MQFFTCIKLSTKHENNLYLQVGKLFFFSICCGAEDEADFNYDPNGEKGPANWGRIHPEWGACSNGSMQSPIDLLSERVDVVSHLGRLSRSYKPANATLRNRGHDMMVRKEGYSNL
jgi:carbonic anhydrase